MKNEKIVYYIYLRNRHKGIPDITHCSLKSQFEQVALYDPEIKTYSNKNVLRTIFTMTYLFKSKYDGSIAYKISMK